jgi:hypothetical protein
MKRVAVLLALAATGACSSWNTGTSPGTDAEDACRDAVEVRAHAAERCGADYQTSYDHYLATDAAGDCKNVHSIRDEDALRNECFSFLRAESCRDMTDGITDPSCAAQLERAQ